MIKKLNILITLGPTREYLDPVRYLTNDSSGQMGLSLGRSLQQSGMNVTLISGPTSLKIPRKIKCISVVTASQMARAVSKYLSKTDVFIATAAVSDYRFSSVKKNKMKKGRSSFSVRLLKNPDILAEAGRWKKTRNKPLLVGFALETGNVAREAKRKLKQKNLDLIIGNKPDSFSSNHIRPFWLEKESSGKWLQRMTKAHLAKKMTRWIKNESR